MTITGRALYYLGVAATGFTSYLCLGALNDAGAFGWVDERITLFKVSITMLLMTAELVYAFIKNSSRFDILAMYLTGGTMINSILMTALYYNENATGIILIAAGIVATILAIISTVLSNIDYYDVPKTKMISFIYYAKSIITGLLIEEYSRYSDNGFTHSVVAGLLFTAVIIYHLGKKNNLSKVAGCVVTFGFIKAIFTDLTFVNAVVSQNFEMELFFILTAVFVVFLKYFWYDGVNSKKIADVFGFIIAVFDFLIMMIHCVDSDRIQCVLTLGIAALIVLIWASSTYDKKYQILSGTVLAITSLYVTRTFWLSIAWWVYLLLAGIGCISIAVLKEKKAKEEFGGDPEAKLVFEIIENGEE